MSFAQGVIQGQSIFEQYNKQFNQGQQKRDLAEVAKAEATESTGFTAEQGQQLEGYVKEGFDNVTFDDKSNAYVAKNAAGEAKTVAMQSVTDLMGNRTAGGADNARAQAYANVIGKTDPLKGFDLRQQLSNQAHVVKRQGREEKQWATEDDVERIDSEIGQKFKQSLVGPDGAPRQATADDYLANSQQRAFALAQRGHTKAADQAMKDHMAQSHIKIQMEAAQRKEAAGKAAAAIGAGDYSVAADFYNRYVPSGSKVTGIEPGKDGQLVMSRTGLDGKAMAPMTFKNQGEALSMLQSLDNPIALYQYSQGEFQNQLSLRREKRADNAEVRANEQLQLSKNAEGRAAASHAVAMAERREIPSVREQLAREADPSISDAGARGARLGIIPVPGSTKEKYSYDPVKVQKTFGELIPGTFGVDDKIKRNPAEEKKFVQFMADNKIRDTDRALVLYQQSKAQGERQSKVNAEKIQARVRENMTPERLAATAKKYNMTIEQVSQELAKQGFTK